jgi:hypothetical protein
MSIELKENIETFKEQGRMKVLQNFDHNMVTLGHNTFGPIIANLVCVHFSISIFQNMFVSS